MSVDLKKVVIGLTQEQYDALRIRADVNDQDLGEAGRDLIAKGLFGEMHGIKVAAARFARATKVVNGG